MSSGGGGRFKSVNANLYFMKNTFLVLLLMAGLFSQEMPAQLPPTPAPVFVRKVWVTMIGNDSQVKSQYIREGSLYRTGDSSVVFTKATDKFYYNTPTEVIPVEKIWDVQVKKRGRAGKGILVGMGAGVLLGGMIGYATYKEPPPNNHFLSIGAPEINASVGALLGLFLGGSVGGIVSGSAPVRYSIPIKGNRDTYATQREKLKKLSITGQ